MRSKRSWAWAGVGASSLLAFLAACGSVSESFVIVTTTDAGADAATDSDATVPDAQADAASDAASDATLGDGSLQDAQVDAGAADTGSGPVVPDGGSVVIVGDAAVVIPPLDPALLGGADGGIVLSDGGLANADGGALTPRQFRDLVNGITCQRISECCCPGCSATEQAQTVSQSKCSSGLGASGLQLILTGNELITLTNLITNPTAQVNCLSLLNSALTSCQSISAATVSNLRAICLSTFTSSLTAGSTCSSSYDCPLNSRCAAADGGFACQPLVPLGGSCGSNNDCSTRAIQGIPPAFCNPTDAGRTCSGYLAEGEVCPYSAACGAGACTVRSDGVKRCSSTLPFAAQGDPASFCTTFAP